MATWEKFTNQKQWETYLKNLLKKNKGALLKSILVIYDNQTEEEKSAGESVENNGIGFNQFDAITMTEIAKKLKDGKKISPKEIAIAKVVMPKYWKQLMRASKRKMEERDLERAFEKSIEQAEESIKREERIREEIRYSCLEEGKSCEFGICSECPYIITGVNRNE